MERNEAVVVDGVSRFYGSNKVVRDISFSVEKGSIHGFLGPNGAGKTTTMKMICGVIPPSSGKIILNNTSIGMLLENPPLFMDMKVRDYLIYICQIQGISKKSINSYVEDSIDKLNLQSVSSRLIKNLSKGFKQRVGVAGAIVFKPNLVVLDEPTVGLDPESVIEMRDVIKEISKDYTVLISSHLLHEIEILCDHVTIINKGEIIASDEINAIKNLSSIHSRHFLELVGDKKTLIEKLERLEFIQAIELSDQDHSYTLKFSLKTKEDKRAEIFKVIKETEAILLQFKSEKSNLEDTFLDLLRAKK